MISRRLLGWLVRLRDHGFGDSSNGYFQSNGLSLPIILGEPILFPMLVVLVVVWLLPHTPFPTRLHTSLNTTYHSLPSVKVNYHPTTTALSLYPRNKTALYLEPRPLPFLTPLLLHMLMVIPPSWSVVFLGNTKTAEMARTSHIVARYEELGKLRVVDIEGGSGRRWSEAWGRRWDDLSVDEMGNRLLTNLSFYEEELRGVQWLLVWHSDAILCANAEVDMEEWVGWDWVGAPWVGGGRFGGNGGLSIRNVERVKEVLRFQERLDDTNGEDQWLSARLGLMPDANMCPPEKEREWAVADVWHEWPMGYHVNPQGMSADVWEPYAKRKMIYDFCPEIKIILDMKLEREQCVEPPKIETLLNLPPPAPGSAEIETPPASGMMKEEYSARFSNGEAGDGDLKNQIKELEETMAELKNGESTDEDTSESSEVDQELGDPEIADFAHVEGIIAGSVEEG